MAQKPTVYDVGNDYEGRLYTNERPRNPIQRRVYSDHKFKPRPTEHHCVRCGVTRDVEQRYRDVTGRVLRSEPPCDPYGLT